MKLFKHIALICIAAAFVSCDDSETFYTTSYPLVRVEVSTTVKEEVPLTPEEPTTPEEPPTPEVPASVEEPPVVEPIIEIINREVLAAAPVRAGGRYTLDFTRHNGGTLTVDTATDAGQLSGTFDKIPGKNELTFHFGEQEYTCTTSSYTDDAGLRKVLLSVDLTKQYQELYPDAKITGVTRLEYTSTPFK